MTRTVAFFLLGSLSLYFFTIAAEAPVTAAETAAPQKFETLTPAQLSSLPEATNIIVPTGETTTRTTTLGILRQEHTARMKRFSEVPVVSAKLIATLNAALKSVPSSATLVPMMVPKEMAIDYESFCGSVRASGCLYFPGPATLQQGYLKFSNGLIVPVYQDFDYQVDAATCKSEGGAFGGQCTYSYPMQYQGDFTPAPPAPGQQIGANVTSQQLCPAPLSSTVDPKGSVLLKVNAPSPNAAFSTLQTDTCVTWIYVPTSK